MDALGKVYPEFTKLKEYRRTFNESNYDSLLKTGAQDWYSPTGDYAMKSQDTVRDPNTVHSCFETPELEEAILELFKKTGIQADMILMQNQLYYIAENENVFRRRHATVPKMLANRMGIKAITAFSAEEDLIDHVIDYYYVDASKQQLKEKQG